MERSAGVRRLLYTACSRAKTYDQLYFVGGLNCSNVMDELRARGEEATREACEREAMGGEDVSAAWHAVAAGEEPGAAEVAPFSRSNITPEAVKTFFKK